MGENSKSIDASDSCDFVQGLIDNTARTLGMLLLDKKIGQHFQYFRQYQEARADINRNDGYKKKKAQHFGEKKFEAETMGGKSGIIQRSWNEKIPKAKSGQTNSSKRKYLNKRKNSDGSDNGDCMKNIKKRRLNMTSEFGPNEKYAASGSKNQLHGITYQLKLLMVFVKRGLDNKYLFRLATEMDAAKYIDDLVFHFVNKNKNNEPCYRFLQAKHTLCKSKGISSSDLLNENQGEFSLQKYFASYRKIMRNPEFRKSAHIDFIVCTNIDFNIELKINGFSQSVLWKESEPDLMLDFKGIHKQPSRYKFNVNKDTHLYNILKRSSDIYQLAKILAKSLHNSKPLTLKNEFFQRYHVPLAKEIINVEEKKFFDHFVEGKNLTKSGEKFREIFSDEAKKIFGEKMAEDITNDVLWGRIKEIQLKLPSSFGQRFEISTEPLLRSIEQFTEILVKLINDSSNDGVVIIDTSKYRRSSKIGTTEKMFADNMHELAGHVFVTAPGKLVRFRSKFFDDSIKLSGNLKKFTDLLKSKLGSKYNELHQYRFAIPTMDTCTEKELYSKPELPINDDVTDKEIHEFFSQLIFAVNQPDENELERIIKEAMAEDDQFNLLDADLVGDSFQVKMLDWFKKKSKEADKEGRFFSNNEGRESFDLLQDKVNNLVTIGLNTAYIEELKKYDIDFESKNQPLERFLTTNSRHPVEILIMTAEETLLSAIRVYRAMVKTKKYTRSDSSIYVRLGMLRLPGVRTRTLQAFRSKKSYELLVIDCETAIWKDCRELYDKLRKMESKNIRKKVIFIVQENGDEQSREYWMNSSHIIDNVGFLDLKTISQKKLVEKKIVNFCGQKESTSLEKLLSLQEIRMFASLIDGKTLLKLVCDKEIKVGNDELQEIGNIKNSYITRNFYRRVVIKHEVLELEAMLDLLAISVENCESLERLGSKRRHVHASDFDRCDTYSNIVIHLDGEKESEQFETLCNKTSRNIHWLKDIDGKLYWQRSKDSIRNLMKYRDVDERSSTDDSTYISEEKLCDHAGGSRVVIISDYTGMGKTMTLKYLTMQMIQKELEIAHTGKSPRWVIKINLNDFTTMFAEELRNRSFDRIDTNGAVEFFIEKLSRLETKFEKKILRSMIDSGNRVVLLFDEFDQISPTFTDILLDLLYALKEKEPARLFVATRPSMRKKLEKKLEEFSHAMVAFSKADQINFIHKYCNTNDSKTITEQQLKTYLKAFGKKITHSVQNDFYAVPLHIWMMSVIIDSELPQSENLNIFDIYQIFVDKMLDRYLSEKKNNNAPQLGEQKRAWTIARGLYLKKQEHLAFDALFKNETFDETSTSSVRTLLPMLFSKEKLGIIEKNLAQINEGGDKVGIIMCVIDGKACFMHRTFAEYFVANFFIKALPKYVDNDLRVQEFFVKHILLEHTSRFRNIRSFINDLLLSKSANDELMSVDWKTDRQEYINELGETIFHIATAEGHFEIIHYFLKQFEEQGSNTCMDLIKVRDRIHKRTVLHVAATSHHWDKVLWLIEIGGVEVDVKDKKGKTVLHYAASAGQLDLVKSLVEEKDSDISIRTSSGLTLLHCAVFSGVIPLVNWLVNVKGFNVNEKYVESGKSILHFAVKYGKLDVLKSLIHKNGGDIKARCKKGRTLQDSAKKYDNRQILQWLNSQQRADITSESNYKQRKVTFDKKQSPDSRLCKLLLIRDTIFSGYRDSGEISNHVSP